MEAISLRLPAELAHALEEVAHELGIKKSKLIRNILGKSELLKKRKKSFADSAAKFAGILDAPKDLSTNPDYFADYGK